MREQVIVLPPSVEGRKESFSLSKKEAALLHTRKEIGKWAVYEAENAEQPRSFALMESDHKEVVSAELDISAENMKPRDAKEALAEPLREACEDVEQAQPCAEARLTSETMRDSPSSNDKDAPLLRWGLKKQRRRGEIHNSGSQVDKHNLEPDSATNESFVLLHKVLRVQADKATEARPNTSSHLFEGLVKAKNGVVGEKKDLWTDRKQNQEAEALKRGPSAAKQCSTGSAFREGKRGNPSLHKQVQLLQQSKTCTLADPKSSPEDECVIPLPGGNNASLFKGEFVWPKLVIALSRREKEEDFLKVRGSKLPRRPKRRPKVVERALQYCSPGSWLVDISPSRYDAKEKKRARKRPRGLKAMESQDSDSD